MTAGIQIWQQGYKYDNRDTNMTAGIQIGQQEYKNYSRDTNMTVWIQIRQQNYPNIAVKGFPKSEIIPAFEQKFPPFTDMPAQYQIEISGNCLTTDCHICHLWQLTDNWRSSLISLKTLKYLITDQLTTDRLKIYRLTNDFQLTDFSEKWLTTDWHSWQPADTLYPNCLSKQLSSGYFPSRLTASTQHREIRKFHTNTKSIKGLCIVKGRFPTK